MPKRDDTPARMTSRLSVPMREEERDLIVRAGQKRAEEAGRYGAAGEIRAELLRWARRVLGKDGKR